MSRKQSGQSAEQKKFLPQLETLEDRCCPSVTVQQHGDTLRIRGDDAPDTVAIVATYGIVTVNANPGQTSGTGGQTTGGQLNTFFGIKKIDVDLKGGNDAVIFETGGVMASPLDPNPFVQAAQTQNRMFIDFLLANPSLLQNSAIQKLVRFGERLKVDVDGGKGVDAFFANADTFSNSNKFLTTPIKLDLDDVEFPLPTSFLNNAAAVAFYGLVPPNFLGVI